MRKRIIAGNWKQNGSVDLCDQFTDRLQQATIPDNTKVVLCPPAVYIDRLASALANETARIQIGAQNVAAQKDGAFTGEISAPMLAESGTGYCIVGHSERRELFGETDQQIASKTALLLETSIAPILCVGESLACREAGEANKFVAEQLSAAFRQLPAALTGQVVVAYEPIWAIGTGVSAQPEQVQEMHAHIRSVLAEFTDANETSLLYGGSVKADNAAQLLALDDVDGALIGGASLDVEQFLGIVSMVDA